VRRLHLSVEAIGYAVTQVFDLLRESKLSGLRHLSIRFEHVDAYNGGACRFDLSWPVSGARELAYWKLPDEMTKILEEVKLSFPKIQRLYGANSLYGLFGAANRPGVLKVEGG
jgi:hypothetical protein